MRELYDDSTIRLCASGTGNRYDFTHSAGVTDLLKSFFFCFHRGGQLPESPEAQTIVDGLKKLIENRSIVSVTAVGGRYASKSIPGCTKEFKALCHPVQRIYRHAKAIVIEFTTNSSVVVNLGMTGKFSLGKEKHAAVEFVCDDSSNGQKFYFVDQRRFGTVKVVPTENLSKVLPRIGWDALSEEVDVDRVSTNMARNGTIGSAMLDNRIFSGIGNYLRAEILYAAKISPWRKCSSLAREELSRICEESRRICLLSYELGGNTIENFVDLSGSSGKYFEKLKVYRKRRDPDGNEVVAEATPEGRTIHWVPAVQS